jgi:hypothetical protein
MTKNKNSKCLNCDEIISNDNNYICNECYKLNLNTIYKNIKNKCPEDMTLQTLKNLVRNEKHLNFDNKPKCEISVNLGKYTIEF